MKRIVSITWDLCQIHTYVQKRNIIKKYQNILTFPSAPCCQRINLVSARSLSLRGNELYTKCYIKELASLYFYFIAISFSHYSVINPL